MKNDRLLSSLHHLGALFPQIFHFSKERTKEKESKKQATGSKRDDENKKKKSNHNEVQVSVF